MCMSAFNGAAKLSVNIGALPLFNHCVHAELLTRNEGAALPEMLPPIRTREEA